MELDELKFETKIRINAYYECYIQEIYPYLRLIDIVTNIENGLDELKVFIQETKAERDDLLSQLDQIVTDDTLETFVKGSDEERLASVDEICPDLTENQQTAVAEALTPSVEE